MPHIGGESPPFPGDTIRIAALPPDVREVYDLPTARMDFGAIPLKDGAQPQTQSHFREVRDLPHIGRQSRETHNPLPQLLPSMLSSQLLRSRS
jgi:hypothetical protein